MGFERRFTPLLIAAVTFVTSGLGAQTVSTAGHVLHLLAASPAPLSAAYEAGLYKFENGKQFQLVRRLASSNDGILFLIPDFDSEFIAVGKPHNELHTVDLISMRNPEQVITRSVHVEALPRSAWVDTPNHPVSQKHKANYLELERSFPARARSRVMGENLISRGGQNLLALLLEGNDERPEVSSWAYLGLVLTATTPARAFEIIQGSDFATLRVQGQFGFESGDLADVISEGGGWSVNTPVGRKPIEIPPMANLPSERLGWKLRVRGRDATLLELGTAPTARSAGLYARVAAKGSFWLYRSNTQKWEAFPFVGQYPLIRHVNTWIMGIVGESANGRSSPGSEHWRKSNLRGRAPSRPDTAQAIHHGEYYYPGKLFLYNTESGIYMAVETGEGDSEPLLVQDNLLIYRVNDRILQAEIRGTGLGTPVELARADELRDVHWAFFSQP